MGSPLCGYGVLRVGSTELWGPHSNGASLRWLRGPQGGEHIYGVPRVGVGWGGQVVMGSPKWGGYLGALHLVVGVLWGRGPVVAVAVAVTAVVVGGTTGATWKGGRNWGTIGALRHF